MSKPFLATNDGEHLHPQSDAGLKKATSHSTTGGVGSTFGGMSDRLTALETHFGYVRRDLDELKSGQADIHRALSGVSTTLTNVSSQMTVDKAEIRTDLAKLATKADLSSWKLQWTAIGFAMVALIVGSIIGGLSWIAP